MSLRFVTSPGGGLGANSNNFSRASYIQGAVPVIFPSTGAGVSATGLVTGLTALAISSGNCWGVLPAGYLSAAGAGSAAGVYFGQIQSATSILFFNNTLVGINNSFATPASPTAFSGLAGGTFTQVTTAQTAVTVTIPGNTLGPNGRLFMQIAESNNNSAGLKTTIVQWGGVTMISVAPTTALALVFERTLINEGVTNAQVSQAAGATGTGTGFGNPLRFTADTTAPVNLTFNGTLAVATDTMQFDFIWIEVLPS